MSEYVIKDGELYHHGVKGMKWGVRKIKRVAKKDAKKFARAKMYYGEGAGIRRRLIKAKVYERSKDERYKKAFDEYLSAQDMAKHATKAKAERVRNTTGKKTVETGKDLVNAAMGNIGGVSVTAAAIYTIAHATGADKVVVKYAKEKASNIIGRMKR